MAKILGPFMFGDGVSIIGSRLRITFDVLFLPTLGIFRLLLPSFRGSYSVAVPPRTLLQHNDPFHLLESGATSVKFTQAEMRKPDEELERELDALNEIEIQNKMFRSTFLCSKRPPTAGSWQHTLIYTRNSFHICLVVA